MNNETKLNGVKDEIINVSNTDEELNKDTENKEEQQDSDAVISKEDLEKERRLKRKNDIISVTVGIIAIIGIIISSIMKNK